ncbi:hypothetical protein Tco_1133942 [Tanacetum coccineum]
MSSLKEDIYSIKTMITEMYEVFKGQSSSSVTPTLALTHIPVNVKGENATNTATKEPPSHTEGETDDPKLAIPISLIQPTKVLSTQAQPIITITTHPEISQAVLRIDKGKGITNESEEDPSKKLMYYLTDKELQAYLDKEEKLRKAIEEERLLAISKPEVIKVVQEEAKKIRLNPKKIVSAKASEKFKKAQDAKHQVLKREHTEKKLNVHKPFAFGAFGISELDGLREIIPKKKNADVQDLMNSLSQRKKRKHMELEAEIKIPGLECNRALLENVLFVNNMVIEESEHGIFFTDEYYDQAF